MPDAPAYEVFLSHSHDDADTVEQLAKLLRDKGLNVWLDKWVLVPGRPWRQGMAKGLDQAASCAVCIGTRTPKGWFEQEIGRALNRQSQHPDLGVIPVILPGGDRSLVDDFLELNTWVIFSSDISDPDAVHRLICGIKGIPPGAGPDAPTAKLAPLFTVPLPANPFFTERAHELSDLQAALEKTGSFALTGLGGVGKTQTAAEYAHRNRADYAAVLWLRAEKEDTLFADLTALARTLKLPEADAQEQQLAVDAAQHWLDDNDNWLLILDNVTNLKTVESLTRKARPNRHHLIVTQQAQATGAIASKQHLPSMSEETGALLLLRRAQRIPADAELSAADSADAASAKKTSHEVGGLPLAIDQAGAYISQTGCSVGEYLHLLHDSMTDLLDRRGDLDFEHRSVTATYAASLAELAGADSGSPLTATGRAGLPASVERTPETGRAAPPAGVERTPETGRAGLPAGVERTPEIGRAGPQAGVERTPETGRAGLQASVNRTLENPGASAPAVAQPGPGPDSPQQLRKTSTPNEAAAELMKAVAFLAPDAIPEEIFTAGASEFPEALQAAAANRLQWNDAIAAAFKFSLLERNPNDKTIAVHRMVQAVAKAGMTKEERTQWAKRVSNAVNAAFPDIEFSNWKAYDRLLPHAQLCAALIDEYSLSTDAASRLLNQTGYYLSERARYADAEPLMRRAVEIAFQFRRDTGHEHPKQTLRVTNYRLLLQQMGYSNTQIRANLRDLAGPYGLSLDE
ncbi:MAG TPA: TIR domain-containing protein [Candidatus Eisenbacteria bacterium]|nr:TIR domain-containing protein [Candidatus Eisenbacteria bacterium]